MFRLISGHERHLRTRPDQIYDIFEGTEQIQQLVISRAISGLRIE
jgi:alkylation response protein AidB-like acyl-CoA dehydrogenase